jgi:hypothetical protein
MKTRSNQRRLKRAIKEGRIRSFDQIFKYVDQRSLFKAAGLNPYGPAVKRINDVRLFKVGEIYQLAEVIGIAGLKLLEIIANPVPENKF